MRGLTIDVSIFNAEFSNTLSIICRYKTYINDWDTECYLVLDGYQVRKYIKKPLQVTEKDIFFTDFYT